VKRSEIPKFVGRFKYICLRLVEEWINCIRVTGCKIEFGIKKFGD
jgi:hypothetical protein